MQTEQFILEVVKVMIPVLTGFLVLVAKAVGIYWRVKTRISQRDIVFVSLIAACGLVSFGFWAGALAGAMISISGEGGQMYWFAVDNSEALLWARRFIAYAYNFFVITVLVSGVYYLLLTREQGLHSSGTD